jgi:hypothetical protein
MIAAIRAAVAAVIAAVPEIGVVHDRERYAASNAKLAALYQWTSPGGEKLLRGWFVEFRSQSTGKRVGRRTETLTWEICGLIGFDDDGDSAGVAGRLTAAVKTAIEADPALGGVVNRLGRPEEGDEGTVFIAAVEPVTFAGLICHRARLTFTTEHFS